LAGAHGAFALLVALAQRAQSGRGHLVESTMVESALAVAAEQVVEWSAYGRLLGRDGNRSPVAAPQGLYPCAAGPSGMDAWVAIAIGDDAEWQALRALMGDPAWAADPALDARAGRRRAHDAVDAGLRAWTRGQERAALVTRLRAAGVLASEVADPCRLLETNPQLRARRYFEAVEHPVVGAMPLPTWPYRQEGVSRWLWGSAPTLGRDNDAVLGGILGLSAAERAELVAAGVVGTHPRGL
jgi:crotonobetainyl-CoA:carnitine CoA-transferase CaiB-like acyl-CoA transferase